MKGIEKVLKEMNWEPYSTEYGEPEGHTTFVYMGSWKGNVRYIALCVDADTLPGYEVESMKRRLAQELLEGRTN